MIASLVIGAGACATLKPPTTTSGPASSPTGVQIAVVRQLCAESQPFDAYTNWIDETVELEVQNGSSESLSIHRDKFHLIGPDGSAVASAASTDPLVLEKGAKRTFEVTFSSRAGIAGLGCRKPMRLDSRAAITAREAPVAFREVSFVPSL
jgi:hypothetical protein